MARWPLLQPALDRVDHRQTLRAPRILRGDIQLRLIRLRLIGLGQTRHQRSGSGLQFNLGRLNAVAAHRLVLALAFNFMPSTAIVLRRTKPHSRADHAKAS